MKKILFLMSTIACLMVSCQNDVDEFADKEMALRIGYRLVDSDLQITNSLGETVRFMWELNSIDFVGKK